MLENTMKDRYVLANEIFDLLSSDEAAGMSLWKDSLSVLKMKEKDLPMVDVLTTVYNAEQYIANAIDSVLLQSYPNLHLVIVTDPCTDRTIDIIKDYQKTYPNITLLENRERKGIIDCLNQGLQLCKSDLIARMDLDDLIHPQRIEKQVEYLNAHKECDALSSGMIVFNEKNERHLVSYRDDFDLQKITLLFYSPLSHAATIFRGHVLRELGYRQAFNYAEDFDLWTRLMVKYRTAVYHEPLYLYRTHSAQTTNEKNLDRIMDVLIRINTELLAKLDITLDQEDREFYVRHVMLSKGIRTKEDFVRFNSIFTRIVKANRRLKFFNNEKLKRFIFTNYWQTAFVDYYGKLGGKQFREISKSPLNLFGFKGRWNYKVRRMLGK